MKVKNYSPRQAVFLYKKKLIEIDICMIILKWTPEDGLVPILSHFHHYQNI